MKPSPNPEIWIMLDYYLPSYRAGGPIQSIANLVEAFGDEFNFRIITSDRDLGSAASHPVQTCSWTRVGKAQAMYLPPGYRGLAAMIRVLHHGNPRVLYLNSLFSRRYSFFPMLLRRLSLVESGQVVLAPRGELSESALRIKARRKRIFLWITRIIGFYRGVLWHASTQWEKKDICRKSSEAVPVITACDLGKRTDLKDIPLRRRKPAGELRVVFLSRVCRMKNLLGALEMLRSVSGRVQFTVYGPIEDAAYWKSCQALIPRLPANVNVRYAGEIPHDLVCSTLQEHDVLLLPTLGENFGHVILEALQAGCPAIISDRTAFRDLHAAGAGWDIPLENTSQFERVLQQCIDIGPEDFQIMRGHAFEFAQQATCDPAPLDENRALLLTALEARGLRKCGNAAVRAAAESD